MTVGREITIVDIITDKGNLTNIYYNYSDKKEHYKASKLETAGKTAKLNVRVYSSGVA